MSENVLLLALLLLVGVVSLFVVPQSIANNDSLFLAFVKEILSVAIETDSSIQQKVVGEGEELSRVPLFDIIIEPVGEEGEIPTGVGMFVLVGSSLIILATVFMIIYGKLKRKDNPQQ